MDSSYEGKKPEDLINFCQDLQTDSEMAAKVATAENPNQILEVASSLGYRISAPELRRWSNELSAPHFHWAGKGREWRREFFNRTEGQ
jgi:predicted ribosomally synthesized peptide with nif11-like leader